MLRLRHLLTASGAVLLSLQAQAAGVDEAPMGEAVERHLSDDVTFMQWVQDPERIARDEGDTLETREIVADELETVKLSNVVPPIHFASGVAKIPESTVESLAGILERMRDRINVRLHLIGHADNRPLSTRLEKIYGDNAGLSRERAGLVAEHFQTSLTLPPEAISYEWAGDADPIASNLTPEGQGLNRRVEIEVWYDEVKERVALEEFLVPHEIKRIKVCRMETVCKLRFVDGHARRARVQNLIVPLHYEDEKIEVTQSFVEQVRQSLENLSDKNNVIVRFVGFTDDVPLTGRTERIYGDHVGLSRARARRVALAVQESLGVPTAAIDSDGQGSARPLGSNETARGRALNRRVEVEFWYDDSLQELPDEPQLCPESAGSELVTRVYDPPWGRIDDIEFVNGQPVVPGTYSEKLRRALADVADKTNARLRFVGYTRNERLTRRTASVYGDDIGFSASRARRAMEQIAADMQLTPEQHEFEGRGYVHSKDVVNAGFTLGETSHVAIEVVYDELAVLDDYDGVDITRLTREITPRNPLGLNLMRITVDGVPIDDPKRSSSDIQRCTDVAMQSADIQFGFDNLRSAPRLSGAVSPQQVRISRIIDHETLVSPVQFRMYANYSHFIERAEVRVFETSQSLEAEPLDVIDIEVDSVAVWQPPALWFTGPTHELAFVIRAYDVDGNFDETHPQPLWVVYGPVEKPEDAEPEDAADPEPELLAAYGPNALSLHDINRGSGTVSVRGTGIAAEQDVYVAGRPVAVDPDGSFIVEEILPDGAHTVEVAVIDEEGSGELYLRDLELESNDWFYVGMADLTLSSGSTSGPIGLLQGDNPQQDIDSNADGRVAFFVNGEFGDDWNLTASADTREGSLDEIFSNFMEKSPQALFRRIDPDYFYPTFGDDGTVQEMAPTQGKFFVRVSDDDRYAQWGNFTVGYMDNELAQVDRGLYGANIHYQTDATTDFGEQRFAVDAFAAEPGTVPGRDEFRGTGGSLYFLNRQDILVGSERVRIEFRDKASGIVTGVANMTPVMDYDIDYLQGRILLNEALASTVEDGLLVRENALSGNAAYLVVRYEFTPGFDEIDGLSTGGQASVWLGEYLRLGLTADQNGQGEGDNGLNAGDVTLRYDAQSWVKVQQAQSEGLVAMPLQSTDGGFEFVGYDPAAFVDSDAGASRVDVSLASNEVIDYGNSLLTLYVQEVDAGYSAPGMLAIKDTKNYGGTFSMPIAELFDVGAKLDQTEQQLGLETRAYEIDVNYALGYRWDISAGYRVDDRVDRSPLVVATQEQGERTDAILQIGYDSKQDWSAYTFVQDTLSVTGNRSSNARTGVGGSYRVSEALQIDAELSNGDLGQGGRVGTSYLFSERTSAYINYALENERNDSTMLAGRGSQGNLVAGIKTRLADSTSVFLEERYQYDDMMTGMTHATGMTFTPSTAWSFGIKTDVGTLQDQQTGAETERMAGGIQIGAGFESLQFSTGLEYINVDAEQLDLSRTERTTWLFRSNFKYQLSPSSRLLGKLDHSDSESSLGTFYDGGFTEAVFGYALRPVSNDRLNMLAKYTYFYNVPTSGQVSLQNLAAEFIQKSHIGAVDVTYDVKPWFSIGGKYAHRLGQISIDRESSDFFDNNADLFVVRGDVRFRKNWEFLVEGRMLDMADLDERRSGALATISRYLGDHLKIGVGYNFTDFSEDLTDLSFNHHGVFLNLTGTM
jgi:flagellar motor protein MotB